MCPTRAQLSSKNFSSQKIPLFSVSFNYASVVKLHKNAIINQLLKTCLHTCSWNTSALADLPDPPSKSLRLWFRSNQLQMQLMSIDNVFCAVWAPLVQSSNFLSRAATFCRFQTGHRSCAVYMHTHVALFTCDGAFEVLTESFSILLSGSSRNFY